MTPLPSETGPTGAIYIHPHTVHTSTANGHVHSTLLDLCTNIPHSLIPCVYIGVWGRRPQPGTLHYTGRAMYTQTTS